MPPGIAEHRRPMSLDAGRSRALITPPRFPTFLRVEDRRGTASGMRSAGTPQWPNVGRNMQPVPQQFADRLVAGMSDAIVYADAEGVIRLWNRGADPHFRLRRGRSARPVARHHHSRNLRERHWHGYRATMRTGQSRYGDGQILSVPAMRKDGARISVEFTIVPFTDDAGQMIGIAAIMRDATARFEELRALRRELAARSPEVPPQGSASKD